MQHLKNFIVIVFSTCLLIACSNNNAAHNGKDSSGATTSNSDVSSSNGNGSFSYTINGSRVDVKNLYINETKNDVANGRLKFEITNSATSEVLSFSVANSGTTTVLHYSPSLAETKNQATYMSPKYKNYYGDSVTVTLTGIDASHIAGTFSGKYLSGDDTPAPLVITDGSFDIPFKADKMNN